MPVKQMKRYRVCAFSLSYIRSGNIKNTQIDGMKTIIKLLLIYLVVQPVVVTGVVMNVLILVNHSNNLNENGVVNEEIKE